MSNLIKNELFKLYKTRSLLFIFLIFVLVCPFLYYLIMSGFYEDVITKPTIGQRVSAEGELYSTAEIYGDTDGMIYYSSIKKVLEDSYNYDTNLKKSLIEVEGFQYVSKYLYAQDDGDEELYNYYLTGYEELKEDINTLDFDEILKKNKTFWENDLIRYQELLDAETNKKNQISLKDKVGYLEYYINSYKYKNEYKDKFNQDDYSFASSMFTAYYSDGCYDFSDYTLDDLKNDEYASNDYRRAAYEYYSDYQILIKCLKDNKVSTNFLDGYGNSTTVYMGSYSQFSILSVVLLMVIVVGGIVSSEFEIQTIKQLLIRPFSRSKILTSKIIAGLIYIGIFTVAFYLSLLLLSGFIGKFNFADYVVYDFLFNRILTVPFIGCFFLSILSLIFLILIVYFFMILVNVMFKNTNVTGLATFVAWVMGFILNMEAQTEDSVSYICRLLGVSTGDYSYLLFGMPGYFTGSTILVNTITNVITIIIEIALCYYFFNNTDVKNV